MRSVLVDSSVWIDSFRGGETTQTLSKLIDNNLVCTNQIIKLELLPNLLFRNQHEVVRMLELVEDLPLSIDWPELNQIRHKCLSNGLNGVGIPDLIIAQHALHHNVELYTLDKHFTRLATLTGLRLFD